MNNSRIPLYGCMHTHMHKVKIKIRRSSLYFWLSFSKKKGKENSSGTLYLENVVTNSTMKYEVKMNNRLHFTLVCISAV